MAWKALRRPLSPLLLFAVGAALQRCPALVIPTPLPQIVSRTVGKVVITGCHGGGCAHGTRIGEVGVIAGPQGRSGLAFRLAAEQGGEAFGSMEVDSATPEEGYSGEDSALPSLWPASNRLAIGTIATLGALESLFLTYQKMRPGGIGLLCGVNGGCTDVLTGPYSQILGVPLTIPGAMAYLAVAGLSLVPLVKNNNAIDKWTRSGILVLTTAMAVFTGYLMSLLAFKIGHACPWCITSACLSVSMCTISWLKEAVPGKTKAAVMGFCTALITVLSCLTIFFVTETTLNVQLAEASPSELVGLKLESPPEINTDSSPQAMRLGRRLKSLDAKMYGAYWCDHCFNQKQTMGKQAFSKVKYIECSNRGVDNQVATCRAAKIPGFPTWDIDGKLYPGEQSLEELEVIVGLDPFDK